ncbi:ComE operon protein 1 [bacterium HR17]|jgi:general secretion pathway protein K|uniref:ComE operon protein 1 n=1 Tax=Candidatus Fervidibacter japonicus TaxID=2035412 RepID=A0A2H5X8U6_9BACT|nr:ComE operon protein 1 [bacterium HR17]
MTVRRGFALILVLGLLVLLTLLAAGLAFTVRSEVNIASDFADRVRARYLAQAGLHYALQQLMQDGIGVDGATDVWATELRSRDAQLNFADGQFFVRVVDETGKLNLNTADRTTLVAFFTQLTGDSALAEELADSILDWRDSDDTPNPMGAESDYYLSLPQPYRAKNAPFDSPYELLLVKGMTRDLFYGDPQRGTPPLTDLVTTFSAAPNVDERGQPRVNINTATREQLQSALGDVLTPSEIDAILRFRDGGGQQRPFGGTPPSNQPLTPQSPSGQFLPPSGQPLGSGQRPQPPSGQPRPLQRPMGASPSRGVPSETMVPPPASGNAPSGTPAQRPSPMQTPQQGGRPGGQSGGQGQRRRIQSPLDLLAVLPREKLIAVWERLGTDEAPLQYGVINLNTAPAEVLASLLPENPAAAEDIVAYREQHGEFQSVGELLNIPSLTQSELRQLVSRVTVKSAVFRIRAVGVIGNRKVVHLIEAVVQRQPATAPSAEAPTVNEALTVSETLGSEAAVQPVQFIVRYWRER